MFGRLLLPLEEEEVLLVANGAVRHVGQLALVAALTAAAMLTAIPITFVPSFRA